MTFYWTASSLAISAVVLLVALVVSGLSWRRSGYSSTLGWLELFRVLLIACVLVTLNQPEITQEIAPTHQPTLAVLYDTSGSMATRDVTGPYPAYSDGTAVPTPGTQPLPAATLPVTTAGSSGGVEQELTSRSAAVAQAIEPARWKPLEDRLQVAIEPFSSSLPQPEAGTDLAAALSAASEKFPNLRGVVVLSDGDWNAGQPPVTAAAALRARSVPVFSVTVGSEDRLPDLVLSAADAPTFGVVGKTLRLPFRVISWLPTDRDVIVRLTGTRGESIEQRVRVPAMQDRQDTLAWKPEKTGEYELTLEIPVDELEALPENNKVTIPIDIREEALRVLIVESYPRWEYRYLRNALERDPGVEVNCLLFHPDLKSVGAGRGYLEAFPAESALVKYDVVFLGDVGATAGQLTVDQCRDLARLVRTQAAGLVFLPGFRGYQSFLEGTDLAELSPVVMDATQPRGLGSPRPSRLTLTEAGRRSLLTRLEQDDFDNERVWNNLPGSYWVAAVERAKIGAQVLAVHESESTRFGRLPLIATRTIGTGKVLFMGIDSAWRWREGVEDLYHYRFWGQVVRWMAYQRNMSQGESMRLFYSPDRPLSDHVLTLTANVMNAAGEPLRDGTVVVQTLSPTGQSDSIRLTPAGEDSFGMFTGTFTPREGGTYQFITTCVETGTRLETPVAVLGVEREQIGQPARPDVLREISVVTRGRVTEISQLEALVSELAALPPPAPEVRRFRLWSHPAWAGTLVLLLGVFWSLRKLAGLA